MCKHEHCSLAVIVDEDNFIHVVCLTDFHSVLDAF